MRGEKQKGLDFIEEAIERQQKPPDQKELDMMKISGPDSQIFIGSGVGKVSPEYLKFVENYKLL